MPFSLNLSEPALAKFRVETKLFFGLRTFSRNVKITMKDDYKEKSGLGHFLQIQYRYLTMIFYMKAKTFFAKTETFTKITKKLLVKTETGAYTYSMIFCVELNVLSRFHIFKNFS
jgi:hypothetical protein